ncbi:MAG: hypothetical protein P8Z70_10540 [Desulfuromonadales bacterium]
MEELLANFFNSIGQIKEVYTQVDFYQYIKGLEYLICVAFFIVFTKFYKYINGRTDDTKKDH